MCVSLQWLGQVLVWLIVIGGCGAIIKLILPLALGGLGSPGAIVIQIIKFGLWVIIAVFVVWFAIDMIQCLLGAGGGLHLPRR